MQLLSLQWMTSVVCMDFWWILSPQLIQEPNNEVEELALKDPSNDTVVGKSQFLALSRNGNLSFSEFSDLIDAFGNQVAADKVLICLVKRFSRDQLWTCIFISMY